MTPSAQALTDYMSELSESAFCAGWESGLEFDLWRAVVDGPRQYGNLDITAQHITRLRRLSDACGGWIYFDDVTEETFMASTIGGGVMLRIVSDTMLRANQSLQPTPVGVVSSAFAVHAIGPAWLSLGR